MIRHELVEAHGLPIVLRQAATTLGVKISKIILAHCVSLVSVGSKAAAIRGYAKDNLQCDFSIKGVGMTLNRLAKEGRARRAGRVWFPVQQRLQTDNELVSELVPFPGKVLAVSNIPIRVPEHFLGREDALRRSTSLKDALSLFCEALENEVCLFEGAKETLFPRLFALFCGRANRFRRI